MLARKPHTTPAQNFPPEWTQQTAQLLCQTYSELCQQTQREFDVHGQIYADEMLLMICLSQKNNQNGLPLSFFVSLDLPSTPAPQDSEQLLNHLMDFSGTLLDEILPKWQTTDDPTTVYSPHWQEYQYQSDKYYFKITREDIALTLEANRLLTEH